MIASQRLIAHWQERLRESQYWLDRGSSRMRWFRQMQVRLYQFLLSTYRDRLADPAGWEEGKETTSLVDNTAGQVGLPPKSPARIRAAVHKIALLSAPRRSASKASPLREWITVASRSGKIEPTKCRLLLLRHGIRSRAVWRGDDHMVEVPVQWRREALDLIDQHKQELRPTKRYFRRTSLAIGTVVLIIYLLLMLLVWAIRIS